MLYPEVMRPVQNCIRGRMEQCTICDSSINSHTPERMNSSNRHLLLVSFPDPTAYAPYLPRSLGKVWRGANSLHWLRSIDLSGKFAPAKKLVHLTNITRRNGSTGPFSSENIGPSLIVLGSACLLYLRRLVVARRFGRIGRTADS